MRQRKENQETVLRHNSIVREKRLIESNKRWLEKGSGHETFNPACKYSGNPEKLIGK